MLQKTDSDPYASGNGPKAWVSPSPGILHRGPGLLGGLGLAPLQQLDGDPVRRAHEGHVAVARRAIDRHTGVHELPTGLVDVIDPIGEMPEVPSADIFVLVP